MLKTFLIIISIVAIFGIQRVSALFGDLPATNSQQGTGVIALDFSSSLTHQQIGIFLINSNDASGFHVVFNFANKGIFKTGTLQIPMTNIVLNKISGTLGAPMVDPVDLSITLDGSGNWTWSPSVPTLPTTETVNYLVEIAVNWTIPAGKIAGFYRETISCSVLPGP